MNEYDSVILTKSYETLPLGTKGCIVLKYDENNFEAEFFDENGDTIGVYTVSSDYIRKV